MTVHRLLHVSDTHLDPTGGAPLANWTRIVRHATEEPCDLVVHGGDVLLHEPDDDANHRCARAALDRLPAPWCAVPGNHDVGDGPPEPWFGEAITAERRARWLAHWGADWWERRLGAWRLLGLNGPLLGSGLAAEAEQWAWLETALADTRAPIALFLHKPLFVATPDEPGSTDVVPAAARDRLLARLTASSVRLVASGHCHEYRTLAWRGISFVWAPTTAFITRREVPGPAGIRRAGCVRYAFEGETVGHRLVEPDGLAVFDNRFLHARRKALGLPYNAAVVDA